MDLEGVLYACGRTAATGRLVAIPGGYRFDPQPGAARWLAVPGLVNAHDHLHLNAFPRTRFRDRYSHAVDWVRDMAVHLDGGAFDGLRGLPEDARAWHGAAKNALSGAVLVVHHDPRLAVFDHPDFPVTVAGPNGWTHSVPLGDASWRDEHGPAPRYGPAPAASVAATPPGAPWFAHVAEGTDLRAAAELGYLDAAGAIGGQARLVHGVGLAPDGVRRVRDAGAALVWCPSANEFLLGAQPQAAEFAAGLLALGTDARLTGARDLLAELSAARSTTLVSSTDLLDAVTASGRRLVGAPAADQSRLVDLAVLPLGRGGAAGDLGSEALTRLAANRLVHSTRADLALVVARGRPVMADPELAAVFSAASEPVQEAVLDGAPKVVATRAVRTWLEAGLREPGLDMAAV